MLFDCYWDLHTLLLIVEDAAYSDEPPHDGLLPTHRFAEGIQRRHGDVAAALQKLTKAYGGDGSLLEAVTEKHWQKLAALRGKLARAGLGGSSGRTLSEQDVIQLVRTIYQCKCAIVDAMNGTVERAIQGAAAAGLPPLQTEQDGLATYNRMVTDVSAYGLIGSGHL